MPRRTATDAKMGRPEEVTESEAKAIVRMIERMPDAQIPVTWKNVIEHCGKRFGKTPSRQTLSQKEWSGKKLIGIAFSGAQELQRQYRRGAAPKYATSPRSVLQQRILTLEVQVQNLTDELEKVRCQQIEELDAFMTTPLELRAVLRKAGLV